MIRKIRTYSRDTTLVAERRRQIVKAAARLFLKKGHQDTKTRELCEATGMSIGALYHYVGSMRDIHYLVLEYTLEDQAILINRISREVNELPVVDAIEASLKMYLMNVDELQDIYSFANHGATDLLRSDKPIVFEAELQISNYFESILKKGIESGEFKIVNPKLVAHNIVLIANAWAQRQWLLGKQYSLDEYIKQQTEYILQSICVKPVSKDGDMLEKMSLASQK